MEEAKQRRHLPVAHHGRAKWCDRGSVTGRHGERASPQKLRGPMTDWHPSVLLKIDGRTVQENTLKLAFISRMDDGSLVVSLFTEREKKPEIKSIA